MPIERIDPVECTGCKICLDSCCMDVIRMDEDGQKAIIKYQADCIACYNCELDCPANAIYVSPQRGRAVIHAW